MRRSVAIALAFLGTVATTGCDGGEGTSETITWKGPLAPGAEFALRNRNGSITVEEGSGDSATLVLTVRRRSRSAASPELKVLQTPEGVIACVMHPSSGECSADGYDAAKGGGMTAAVTGSMVSVSAVLRLPRGHRLDLATTNGSLRVNAPSVGATLRTSNGSVRAHDVAGPVEATTSNGSVRLYDCVGSTTVRTTNGSVRLFLDSLAGDVNVQTSNGSITAYLRPTVDAAVSLGTSNGSAELDLPGTITSKSRNALEGTIGRGTHKLVLQSSNASVRVRPRESTDDDE